MFELDPVTVAALRAHRTRQHEERLRWGEAWTVAGAGVHSRERRDAKPEWLSKEFQRPRRGGADCPASACTTWAQVRPRQQAGADWQRPE
jgi:hypothetical protein